jgi:hypothetical protein
MTGGAWTDDLAGPRSGRGGAARSWRDSGGAGESVAERC